MIKALITFVVGVVGAIVLFFLAFQALFAAFHLLDVGVCGTPSCFGQVSVGFEDVVVSACLFMVALAFICVVFVSLRGGFRGR